MEISLPQAPKKILVIKLRHIGDVLLTTPVFYALAKQFPNASIDAYVYKDTWPMLEGLSFIRKGWLYDKGWKKEGFFSRIKNELKVLREIKKERYDLVINLTEGDRGAIASWISRAKIKVGVDPKGGGMLGKAKCYTHLIPEVSNIRHTVEMNLDALRILGIFPGVQDRFLHLHIPEEDQLFVHQILNKHLIEHYMLVHPVSRWMFKCIPALTMAKSINMIFDKYQLPVIFTASNANAEMQYINEVIKNLDEEVIYYNMAGKLTLKQLGAFIQQAKALLTVDSVPMHMASALRTPLVAIFGPTSDKRWAPWQHSNAQIIFQNYPCRPCYQPGCAKTHRSDCLETMPAERIAKGFYNLKL